MKNDITGDRLISRPNSDTYRDNFDRIFNSKCGDCDGDGYVYDRSARGVFTGVRFVCAQCNGTGVAPVL